MSVWSEMGSHAISAITGKAQKAVLCIPKVTESTGADSILGDTFGKITSAVNKI